VFLDCVILKDGTDRWSRNDYRFQSTLHDIREERRRNLYRGGSLISRAVTSCLVGSLLPICSAISMRGCLSQKWNLYFFNMRIKYFSFSGYRNSRMVHFTVYCSWPAASRRNVFNPLYDCEKKNEMKIYNSQKKKTGVLGPNISEWSIY
jgi:hypothetical protein